mmetsp:Transcript_4521/g.7072  ORF Transcript_4521/g.7072 Transcript_4521/m.7072 type:complete len:85 (+) Transcript_4521:568-822(+)
MVGISTVAAAPGVGWYVPPDMATTFGVGCEAPLGACCTLAPVPAPAAAAATGAPKLLQGVAVGADEGDEVGAGEPGIARDLEDA